MSAAPDTLIAALVANARDHGSSIAFRERDYGIWQETSWQDALGRVLAVAAGQIGRAHV